jgi:hypothetical protein
MALSRLEVALWIEHLKRKQDAQEIKQQQASMLAKLKSRKK